MKVMKIELCFIDFDDIGESEIKCILENSRLPNHIINPDVMNIKTIDIGQWRDDNLLNGTLTQKSEYERLFNNK